MQTPSLSRHKEWTIELEQGRGILAGEKDVRWVSFLVGKVRASMGLEYDQRKRLRVENWLEVVEWGFRRE